MTISVYPVGWLARLIRVRRYLRNPPPVGRKQAWSEIAYELETNRRQIRERKWRDLKNTFNGYLAEPDEFPAGEYRRRCGSGWTKRRALRSLQRRVRQPGVQWDECNREIEKMLGDESWQR